MIRNVELKVGFFLIISIMLIASAVVYVAYKKDFFAEFHKFTLSSKSGEDLTEGMPVLFSGFKIGIVNSLELSEDGSVLIIIKVPERHIKWIRVDSTFIINKPFLGSARIVVITHNMNSPILSPKQIPQVITVSDINELIKKAQPLLENINKIAGNIEKLTASLAAPDSDFQKILANAEEVTGNLASKKSLLEMAVSDKQSIDSIYAALKQAKDITANAQSVLEKIDNLAKKTDDMVYSKDGTLPTINEGLKDLLTKLKKLDVTVDNINKISSEAADSTIDLRLLRDEIDAAVNSIGKLSKELEQKIPFRKKPEIKLP